MIVSPFMSKAFALVLCALITTSPAAVCVGCQPGRPTGPGGDHPEAGTAISSPAKSEPAGRAGDLAEPGKNAGSRDDWLKHRDLSAYLPAIRQEAEKEGFAVSLNCPDEETGGQFLCAAQDKASADALNGFFYWYAGTAENDPDGEPLILGLDRLFPENSRQAAISGGQFSDPAVIRLLEKSLRLILGNDDLDDLLDFILTCYRDDFASRLESREQPAGRSWQKDFQRFEVIYRASVFSTVSFRVQK